MRKGSEPGPELVGRAEVAEILGVHRSNVGKVKELPAPVQRVRATYLWRKDEIEAFAKERSTKAK